MNKMAAILAKTIQILNVFGIRAPTVANNYRWKKSTVGIENNHFEEIFHNDCV